MIIPISQNETYRKTQIDTAGPEMLVLMLYDGALKFMSKAQDAFEQGDKQEINNMLLRVQAIITELLTSLDKEKGGEVAINLERLYIFFLEKLSDSNINKDVKPLNEIRPLIQDLRDTWAEIVKQSVKPVPQPAPIPRISISA